MAPKIIPVQEDKFVKFPKVQGLIDCNFYHFLNDKNVALVMFYSPNCNDCKRERAQIIRASKITKRENHAYAAVDCTLQTDLCKREGVTVLPAFKLYTRGRFLSQRNFPIDYLRMKELIDQVDVLPPTHPSQIKVDPPCKKGGGAARPPPPPPQHH